MHYRYLQIGGGRDLRHWTSSSFIKGKYKIRQEKDPMDYFVS